MQTSLIICLIFFLVLLIALERLHSIKIILRIIVSLAIVYGYIQAIINGLSIVLSSTTTAILLVTTNVLIKNGFKRRTITEILSVLVVSGITSLMVFFICKSEGLKMYQDEILIFNGLKKTENVMFSIFLIGTLGIYMDIVSRVIFRLHEQKDQTVDVPWKEQFKQGIDIGQKYIGEKINNMSLVLIVVALLPICVTLNRDVGITDAFNQPDIFSYLLITIVASIGIVISAPITAVAYATINRKKTIYKTTSENKVDGKRSLKL